MKLSEILADVSGDLIGYDETTDITSIEYDSRRVGKGSLFAALSGEHTDGSEFIAQAVDNGAAFVLGAYYHDTCPVGQIVRPDARTALMEISQNFYKNPEEKLELIAVTGTNGKTTIAQILSHVMQKMSLSCGVIGTVEYDLCSEKVPALLTTPESPDFQKYLAEMVKNNAEYAVCEFSSQALSQERVTGENVDYAVFTNLSRDHLDNHGSMNNYFMAKKKLFDRLSPESFAIINTTDPYAERIIQDSEAKVLRVGRDLHDDIRIISEEYRVDKTILVVSFQGRDYFINSALIGEYNAINLLEALGVLFAAGFVIEDVIKAVNDFAGAGGRLQRFDAGRGRTVFVDYAHTDDALANALKVLKNIAKGRIIVVFGCGGDRDRGKRPLMAKVAQRHADIVVLTNDNPRTEDPLQIMNDILSGIEDKSQVTVEYDRKEAIRIGMEMAQDGDVVLVAGKGHEDYQIIGSEKIHFDDREIVSSLISN